MKTKAIYKFKSTIDDDEEEGGLKIFIWNPVKKQFCGRGALSWLKIAVFYIIFYSLLAVYWTAMLLVFYQTLPQDTPKWTLDSSCIGSNPGLTFVPQYYYPSRIYFNHSIHGSWNATVNELRKFIETYDPDRQKEKGGILPTCSFNMSSYPHVCAVNLDQLGDICTTANDFGYAGGTPCIALKLNRIFDWYPEPFKNDTLPSSMPNYLKEAYDPNYVYISCEGDKSADKENLGPVRYFPENGAISNFYYPFRNQDGYVSPFVFVNFERPKTNVTIKIECKAWAANIKHHRSNRMGSARLLLHID